MKTQNKFTVLLAYAVIFLMTGCERDYNNPWDGKASIDPNAWAPQNLAIEDVSITEKKLTWTYTGDDRFEGFKIDRKEGNTAWQEAYQVLPIEARNWNDTQIIPDASLTYSYRVYAFARKYNSAEISFSAEVAFPAPTNVQVEKLTDKSYKINWDDNSTGEQGFKIDRKIDQGNWVVAFGNVPANQTSFTDTNVFRSVNVEYRVYAFFETHESLKIEVATTADLIAPTDLQIEKLTDKSYRLSWIDNSTGEQGFKIDRKIDQGNWVAVFGKVVENQTSFIDTNVFRAVNVEYQVYAFFESQESSKVVTGTTAGLIAPSNLQIMPNSITSLDLTWQDNSDSEEGIKIDRQINEGDWVNEYAIVLTDQTSFIDNDLDWQINEYSYRVYAFNGQINSVKIEAKFSLPSVTTSNITNITTTTATCGGNVTFQGMTEVTARGVCWSANVNPTIDDMHTIDGSGTGSFTSNLTGLSPAINYYIRAYATNSSGTAYGNQIQFTTSAGLLPNVTTTIITNITTTTAIGGGNVTLQGTTSVSARGVCWSISSGPTTSDSHTINGDGTGTFSSNLTGLMPATVYYVRAYATNSAGTSYGNQIQFTTNAGQKPTVTTSNITNITTTTATGGGNVTTQGTTPVSVRGVCWSTTTNPTITSSHTSDGSGTGNFNSNLTSLSPAITYYVRAYATNNAGTSYGDQVQFTTDAGMLPTVTSSNISNITATTATGGGNVTSQGTTTVTARGVCWSFTTNPTISDNHTSNGSGTGSFTSILTGLEPVTTYYVRAYATNSAGTSYGNQQNLTTLQVSAPVVITTQVSNITDISATSGGNITYDGGVTVSARGVCWSSSPNPTIENSHTNNGSGSGSFTSSLTGLIALTDYYVRAYAINSVGTSYGDQIIFSTTASLPSITTTGITNITSTTALGGGNVATQGTFPVSARGICWSNSSNPTINNSHTIDGSGTGIFTSNLTGLNPNTTYYVRAYATSDAGTSYGNQVSFTTVLYTIGQNYGGGIIFYINGTGQHGLIASTSDQSTNAEWGCYNTTIGGTSTTIGSGASNTSKIVTGCSESGIAARICNDLVLNGHSDWFLPSKDELNQMYLQKGVIGGFASYSYWSSSEINNWDAWIQSFGGGVQDYGNKGYSYNVRAIRSF